MTKPAADEFAELIDATPVEQKVAIGEWEGPIPAGVLQTVKKLVADGVPLFAAITDAGKIARYKSVLKAALAEVDPSKSLNTRERINKETGALEGLTFSAGAPRGRKPKGETVEGGSVTPETGPSNA